MLRASTAGDATLGASGKIDRKIILASGEESLVCNARSWVRPLKLLTEGRRQASASCLILRRLYTERQDLERQLPNGQEYNPSVPS
jgi:hypothetical protein